MDATVLTADVPGVPARIKERAEDFVVEELPLYPACGEGEHLYLTIEKRGLTTRDAARRVARALGVADRDVGFAGQKDARAVTRQRLSLRSTETERARTLDLAGLRVLEVERHRNKLRLGHLRGNRFRLRLRGVPEGRLSDVRAVLETLARRGLPNAFGAQRFGARGANHWIGRALLSEDFEAAVRALAGTPAGEAGAAPDESAAVRAARASFDAGDYAASAAAWPRGLREPRRVAEALAKGKDARGALRRLDRPFLSFCVSAWQSHLFNRVLERRLQECDRVRTGDLAWRHVGGAVFAVEDAALEQPRADALEISPTGPLFGGRMTRPSGAPDAIEEAVLDEAGVTRASFEAPSPWRPTGGRRPLRVPVEEPEVEPGSDEHGPYVELRFVLPPGVYATTLVREITKDQGSQG
jgi:tRNA pseudouridine13 synthase